MLWLFSLIKLNLNKLKDFAFWGCGGYNVCFDYFVLNFELKRYSMSALGRELSLN